MNASMQKLVELQALDLRVAELRKQIESFPERLAQIDRTAGAARDALHRAKQHVLECHKGHKKLELDVEDWREKVRKYKDQLYQVKSNEAYKALQEEVRNAELEVSRAEDRLLEHMIGSEEAELQVKQAEAALAEAEAVAAGEKEKLLAEKAVAEKEFIEADAAATAHLAELPGDLVDHYRRIARRHSGIALAPVRDECCSMCSVRIRPHVVQLLRQADNTEMFHCETCTRILYYAAAPQASLAEADNPQASLAEAGNPQASASD
jgi:predicted  nucleic acid-binding Zn-ribbon protein